MAKAYWLLLFCFAWPPATEALSRTIENETRHLSEVTSFIVREHLSKFTSTVLIAECSLKTEINHINTILDYILPRLHEKIAVQLYISTSKSQQWEYCLFIVNSVEALTKLIMKFPMNFNERQFYFLIVLTKCSRNFIKTMERIFQLCYDFEVINANVILDHPTLGVTMFTYRLFSNDSCRTVQPQLYYIFNQSFDHLRIVFPEKLINLHGCPLKVASRIISPMLAFTGNASNPKPSGRWDNLSGFEGTLLKIIAESLNFTIEFLPFSERETCFTEVIGGKADITIGGFSGPDPDRLIMSPSKVYHHTPYMYIVRGGSLLGSLGRLAAPFNYSVWILLAFLLTSGIVILMILKCMSPPIRRFVFGERTDIPIVNFFSVFLGYPISRTPRRSFARYLLMLWLIVTLIIRSAYQGSLYDAVRMNKFVRTPSGINDLMKWNYKLLLSPDIARLHIFPQNITTIVVNGTYMQRFKKMKGTGAKYATLTLRDNYLYYISNAHKNYAYTDLILMNEVVYTYQIVMYFPKHSIYLAQFNKKLQALIVSGISTRIESDFTAQPHMFWKFKQKPPTIALSNERLMGMYEIYAFLTIATLVVFGLELLSVHSARLRWLIERLSQVFN